VTPVTGVIPRRFTVLVLLGALLALCPLAHASPPDETWIGGIYDAADYDDVVLLVTGGLEALENSPAPVLRPVSELVDRVPTTPQPAASEPVPLFESGRAPPLA
jgi:hypothetical protein